MKRSEDKEPESLKSMKQVTLFPLSPFSFKYVGAAISVAGIMLMIFLGPGYQLLLYAGLMILVFSKERKESAYVASVRAEVFKSVFGFTLTLTIALHITEWLSEGFVTDLPPVYLIGFPLLLYLILFYGLLILRVEVDSSRDFTENLHAHPRLYLPWLLIAIAVTLYLLLRLLEVV